MIYYLCETNDTMGIVIGQDANSHLSAKSDLCPSLWVLKFDVEVFRIFWEVIINDIYRDFQLLDTRVEYQLSKTFSDNTQKICVKKMCKNKSRTMTFKLCNS